MRPSRALAGSDLAAFRPRIALLRNAGAGAAASLLTLVASCGGGSGSTGDARVDDASADAGPGNASVDAAIDAPSTDPSADGPEGADGGEMTWGCGTLAPPTADGLCCSSCPPGTSCQANGCYGGWWCDVEACRCVSAPSMAECAAASGGTSDGWPTTTGALACDTPAMYSTVTSSGSRGSWRWSVKTGADANAATVDTTPVVTTTAALVAPPPPGALGFGTPRGAGTEHTVYELRDVQVSFVGRTADSDNHMIIDDGAHSMIVEVPYPGCVAASSVFGCNITHARATLDATFGPVTGSRTVDRVATFIGVDFFDFVHGQPGAAPNGIDPIPCSRSVSVSAAIRSQA